MILLTHILIALASLVFAAIAFIRPTRSRLHLSYLLTGLTIATGTYLVISAPAHMIQSCLTGLVYLGVITTAIVSAQHKLAATEQ